MWRPRHSTRCLLTARSLCTKGKFDGRLGSKLPERQPGSVVIRTAGESATTVTLQAVESPERSRVLTVCIIGPTNAGKSTLMNELIDSRVSIVSRRIHTTRVNTLGFMTDKELQTQVEFIDAPGALGPSVPLLGREMWDALRAADLALVMVDASELVKTLSDRRRCALSHFLSQLTNELTQGVNRNGERTQTALVLNKVDKVHPKVRHSKNHGTRTSVQCLRLFGAESCRSIVLELYSFLPKLYHRHSFLSSANACTSCTSSTIHAS